MSLVPLRREFFARDARVVARALVGHRLVDTRGGALRVARVVETEAYRGPSDRACHARFGVTPRTRALFGAPGTAYVFLVYGMHHCFNVVCFGEGRGHAVLLRAVEIERGFAEPPPRADGPGRLAAALAIDRSLDGHELVAGALHFAAPRALGPVRASASPMRGPTRSCRCASSMRARRRCRARRLGSSGSAWAQRPRARSVSHRAESGRRAPRRRSPRRRRDA